MKPSIITARTIFSTSLLALLTVGATAQTNLFVDPGFENNPLATGNVISNFTLYQGQWGAEAGTITGVIGGVTPFELSKMLSEAFTGGSTSQCYQVTDVSSYASLIDLGVATLHMSALFNVDAGVPAAEGRVNVQFCSDSNFASRTNGLTGFLTLDADPATWETIATSEAIPVGTRWLASQIYYLNASLGAGQAGFVDAAQLTIVPEPASAMLLLGSGAMLLLRRRRAAAR